MNSSASPGTAEKRFAFQSALTLFGFHALSIVMAAQAAIHASFNKRFW
jgi:hypothetical protein